MLLMSHSCPPRLTSPTARVTRTFIDVFAGCGGLSLGLMKSGWTGLFAVERDEFAFDTLSANLLNENGVFKFEWPNWLSAKSTCVMDLLKNHPEELDSLCDKVDLMAGGPPCQGFSSAGRRDSADPRNSLMKSYIALVDKIRPKLVLVENVHGMTLDFVDKEQPESRINYAQILIDQLRVDYHVFVKTINVADFGVPQARKRFFLIAQRKNCFSGTVDPFDILERERLGFLRSKEIWAQVSSSAAISDLEISNAGVLDCPDSNGFMAIGYSGPRTSYQKLMRLGADGVPNSTRLAKHRDHIKSRFANIIDICQKQGRLNTSLSKELRLSLGLKKMALRVLDPDRPSPTITSMPDDLLHYREPRILTVRETARLQSFPDWFEFKGKYTTGGHLRKKEVPRFTQVANAVPPLMAEAIGAALKLWVDQSVNSSNFHSSDASTSVAIV